MPESNVAYLGVLDRYETLSCISQCDSTFAIYDSRQSAFGNPVKIAESIAIGTPVIINKSLSVPERLRTHCTVVRDRSPEAVATAVIQVVESSRRMRTPIDIEDFSVETISEKIILPAYNRLSMYPPSEVRRAR